MELSSQEWLEFEGGVIFRVVSAKRIGVGAPVAAKNDTTTALAGVEVWIDGWATQIAVKGSQMGAQFAQINKPVNLAQQMIARDPILQAKLIKQLRLIVLLSSHHTGRPQ